jgi:uncharacterized protein YecT (DUF1311 family)
VRHPVPAFLPFFALLLNLVASGIGVAADWPQNYIVHKDFESPDGRYGVLVLSHEAAVNQDQTDGNITYLADLQTHQTLGEIRGTDYFEGQNHRDFTVTWAPDSKRCVVTDWGRFGFASSAVLELKDSSFTQTEIGERIQKSLNSVMQKQSHDPEISGEATPYFRLTPDGKVRVRALASNNPKQFDNVKTYYALFQGTFDPQSKKWTATDAHSINSEQNDALESAYQDNFAKQIIVAPDPAKAPENFTGSVFSSEQEKAEYLDKLMNDVYQALRYVLPANRFTQVKQEQIGWLKAREAAQSAEEKSKLTESRIKALQNLLW